MIPVAAVGSDPPVTLADDSPAPEGAPVTTQQKGGQGEQASPVYISYQEKRSAVHSSKPSKKTGAGGSHAYAVRFYLVDAGGGETLAAEGEDQGDAHYLYTNQPGFPFLYCHNKQDVISWLEGILESSKQRAGYHTEVVEDRAPAGDPQAIKLPTFVAYRHEKVELEDGRHAMRWYLIDKQAHEHLAVSGEEKETRDGHYSYSTVGAFHAFKPLECGNQHEVFKWLDSMVVPHHQEGPSGPQGGKTTPPGRRAESAGGTLSAGTVRSDATAATSRGYSGMSRGRPGSKAGGKSGKKGAGGGKRGGVADELLRHATTNLKRKAQAGVASSGGGTRPGTAGGGGDGSPYRAGLYDLEAREAAVGELRKSAQEEAVAREAAKKAALGFLSDTVKPEDAHTLQRSLDTLVRASQAQQHIPLDAKTATHQQLLSLVDLLASLRCVAHTYVPLRAVSSPGLVQALGTLRSHKNKEVSGLAGGILEQWLRTLAAHTAVLADPNYVEDPRKALASRLEDAQELDRLVAELTRQSQQQQQQQPRRAQSPDEDAGGAAGQQGQGAGSAWRPSSAGGGSGLDGATPRGLGDTPSDASLPVLAEDAAGGARTVERRRLDLTGHTGAPGAAAGPASPHDHRQLQGGQEQQQQQQQQQSPFVGLAAAQQQQQQQQQAGAAAAAAGPGGMRPTASQALLETGLPMELDGQLL